MHSTDTGQTGNWAVGRRPVSPRSGVGMVVRTPDRL